MIAPSRGIIPSEYLKSECYIEVAYLAGLRLFQQQDWETFGEKLGRRKYPDLEIR
jgi:hypothetical protein